MGLRHYPDDRPGITRARRGRGFSYFDTAGALITDAAARARCKSLAIPPAYEDAWISPIENGHLLFSGRDARGRKQYRYHPDWIAARDAVKFDGLLTLFEGLPRLRRWIAARLAEDAPSRTLMAAAALALIDRAALRPGASSYARENGSYGATTLKASHVRLSETGVALRFPAKGGHVVEAKLAGARLAQTLHELADLPGPELFSVPGEATLRSEDLRRVLEAECGAGLSPKDLRTWHGTLAAFRVARELPREELSIRAMAEAAAGKLHNTPTIARSSYIHPDVIALAQDVPEAELTRMKALRDDDGPAELRQHERALGRFLGAQD